MTVPEIMAQLQASGSESIKKILLKHGIKEPFFGVKIEHLKPIRKKIKIDYQLAKDLYATGNADAMYLAGLIADDKRMTTADLQTWAEQAVSNNISEYTVPWVAAESDHGYEMALKWIDNKQGYIAAAGWSTLSNLAALKPDTELDIPGFKALLKRVEDTINGAGNRVISKMNAFIIAVGTYLPELTENAISAAKKIGTVTYDTSGTAYKIPDATVYIKKAADKGIIGKKKKTVKC